MKRLAPVLGALALVLAGCSSMSADAGPSARPDTAGPHAEFVSAHGLAGMTPTAIIDHLDRLGVADRPTDLMASVRPNELVLSDSQQEIAIEMRLFADPVGIRS